MRLTIRQAAQLSGISRATLRRYIRAGSLASINQKIDERDLYAYSIEQWERQRETMREKSKL